MVSQKFYDKFFHKTRMLGVALSTSMLFSQPNIVFSKNIPDKNIDLAYYSGIGSTTTERTPSDATKKYSDIVALKPGLLWIELKNQVLEYSFVDLLKNKGFIDNKNQSIITDMEVVKVKGTNKDQKQEFLVILYGTNSFAYFARDGEKINMYIFETKQTLIRETTIPLDYPDMVAIANFSNKGEIISIYDQNKLFQTSLEDVCKMENVTDFNNLEVLDMIKKSYYDQSVGNYDLIEFTIRKKGTDGKGRRYGYSPTLGIVDSLDTN